MVWVLFMVFLTIFCVCAIVNNIIVYLKNPIMTVTNLVSKDQMDFPKILLCSSIKINGSKVETGGAGYNKVTIREAAQNLLSMDSVFNMMNLTYLVNSDEEAKHDQLDPEKVLTKFGMDYTSIFINCISNMHQHNCSELGRPFFSTSEGMGFLINKLEPTPMTQFPVFIIMDMHSELSWEGFPSVLNGLYVSFFEEPNPLLQPDLFISKGSHATIKLKRTDYLRGDFDFHHGCTDDMPRKILSYPYNDATCRMECLSREMLKNGCVPLISKEYLLVKNTSFCSLTSKNMEMVNQSLAKASNCFNQCKPSCRTTKFTHEMSVAQLPSGKLTSSINQLEKADQKFWHRKDDLIILRIEFAEMGYTVIEEINLIDPYTFLSQIGGTLGLFLGASFVSCFQVIVMLIEHFFGIKIMNYSTTSVSPKRSKCHGNSTKNFN